MQKNSRILVVDDHRAIHNDFRKLLVTVPNPTMSDLETTLFGDTQPSADNFELDSAYQGEEGAAMVRRAVAEARPYALAIVDMRMPPGWDGVQTTEKMWEADPNIQIVICTAYSDSSWHEIRQRFGSTDRLLILKKPFDLAEICQMACAMTEKWHRARHAHLQAAETRARLAAMVEASDDALVGTALDGTVLTWNAAAERLYGYTASEVIGRSHELIVPAGKSAELSAILAKVAHGQAGERFDTQRTRKDGSTIDISLTISPMTDPIGRVTGAYTSAREVTSRKRATAELQRLTEEIQRQRLRALDMAQKRAAALEREVLNRKQAEAAVRQERDRAQQYLDAAEVILLALDLDERITLINRKGCDLLGWTEFDLLGRDFIDTCLPARARVAARKQFHGMIRGDLSVVECLVLTKSGEERSVEWRITLLRDDTGRVIGTFSSGADITDRNQAIVALRTAEERMRFALQNAEVGIWDMDYATGVVHWSETLESQYGLGPNTFSGTFEAFVERVHPDDRASVLDIMAKAMTAGGDFSILNRSIHRDGRVRWLSGTGRILLGENGQPVRGVGISLDVTERLALEAQFQQAQKMEAIGRLAGGVAHDFNNLLTAILVYCDLLLADSDPLDPRRADIGEIQKAGTRAAGLMRQLLAFSRKEIIQPTLLDLNVVLTDLREMLGRLIGEDVEVVLRLGTGLAAVQADRGQVEQIVVNLAVHARDAMPTGGILTIETANVELDEYSASTHFSVTPGAYVVLTVSDTGTGMTPDVQAHPVEPFYTTNPPGKGAALGLSTIHGIVTRSGGSLGVYSEVGKGTSFNVYFLRAEAAGRVAGPPPLVTRPHDGGEAVLVVEDADDLRESTTRLLELQGYKVLVASNASEALEVFDLHSSIDVILTDVVMPGVGGPELIEQLIRRRPGLKVIYMSGHTEDTIADHGVFTPGIAFLHKPFTSATLGRKIREVLER